MAQPAVADSSTTTATAFKDTTLIEYSPTTNVGTDYYLYLGDKNGNASRIAVGFYTNIPADQYITNATFKIYVDTFRYDDPVGLTIWVYDLSRDDWTEAKATWLKYNTAGTWTAPGGDYTEPNAASVVYPEDYYYGWLEFTVTDIVQAAYDTTGTYHNYVNLLVMYDNESSEGSHFIDFRSQNYWSSASAPKLIVNYTDVEIPTVDMEMYSTNFYAMTALVDYTLGEFPDINVSVEYRLNGAGSWTSYGIENMVEDGEVYMYTGDVLTENSYYEFRAVANYSDGTVYSSSVYSYTWEEPDITHFISSQAWSATVSVPVVLNDAIDAELWVCTKINGSEDEWTLSDSQVTIIDDTLAFYVDVVSEETYDCIVNASFYDATYTYLYEISTPVKTFTAPLLDEEVQILVTNINYSTNYIYHCIPTFRTNLLLGSAEDCALHFEYRPGAGGAWISTTPFAVTVDGEYNYELTYGLEWNSTYQLRAVVIHDLGTVTGDTTYFDTAPVPASLTTQSAISVTATTATIRGIFTIGGYSYAVGYFVYGKTGTDPSTWVTVDTWAADTSLVLTYNLSSLDENTSYSYFIEAWITNGDWSNLMTGNTLTFTTDRTTEGWVTGLLASVGLDDEAGKMLLAILCIILIPVIVLLVFKGFFIALLAATGVTVFFAAIEYMPLWLIIIVGILLIMGFIAVIRGNSMGGSDA